MTNVTTQITIDIPSLKRFQRVVKSGSGEVKTAFKQWGIRYRSFVQARFNKFSRGGGDWPPLKYRTGSILRDTNTLFTALTPSLSPPRGSVNKLIEYGIEVGYGGYDSHPGGPSIAQIASWHQAGDGNLPERQIIVNPDSTTVRGMVSDMQRALNSESDT